MSEQNPREDAGVGAGGVNAGGAGAGAGGVAGPGAGGAGGAVAGGGAAAGSGGAGASAGAAKLLAAIRKTIGVEQVFGPAYERGDVSVIPVAYVLGAGGAGEGLARLVSDGARRLGIGKWALFTRGGAGVGSPVQDSGETHQTGEGDEAGTNGEADAGAGLFAVCARPAGAYVIRGDEVEWKPAWSLTAAIVGTQAVSVAVTAAAACVLRAKVKRRR